jgi:hypothetical protein
MTSKIKNVSFSIPQEVNNGLLKTINAMPQKDSTSDNQASFSIARRSYDQTFTQKPAINTIKPAYLGMGGPSHRLPTIFDGTSSQNQKKWGKNRDASDIARQRRINAIGLATFNPAGRPLSFESHANANTINSALNRVRAGGAVAPAKKDNNKSNAYTPARSYVAWNAPQKISNSIKIPPVKTSFNF